MYEQKIQNLLKHQNLNDVLALDKELDHLFSLEVEDNEQFLESDELYRGLDPRALLTSYIDYYQILSDIPQGETLYDLGAGLSRGSLISEYLKIGKCVSVESYEPRVLASKKSMNKINGNENYIISADLKDFKIPKAYAYYLYFPKNDCLDIILKQLINIAKERETFLYVCESHGDLIPYIDSLDEFEYISSFKSSLPRHNNAITKYKIQPKTSFKSLSSFLLNEKSTKLFFDISIFHPYFKKIIIWRICSTNLDSVDFKGQRTIRYKHKRIVDKTQNELIQEIVKGQWSDQSTGSKRFLVDGEVYEENEKTGAFIHLNNIKWQQSSDTVSFNLRE